MGREDGRMKYREVFNADASGELVVNDAIEDRSNNASEYNLQEFHRQESLCSSLSQNSPKDLDEIVVESIDSPSQRGI